KQAINGLTYTPGGDRLVSVGADGVLSIWDAGTGAELAHFRQPEMIYVCVAVDSRGGLAAVGTSMGTVLIWDLQAGKQTRVIKAHDKGSVNGVAFHPTGDVLAT